MIKFLIHQLIKWYAGLTKQDFASAIQFAGFAERVIVPEVDTKEGKDEANAKKREYVYDKLRKALPLVATWALNMLLEMAVGYLKKNGEK